MKKCLPEDIDKIGQNPFILFTQGGLQIHQVPGCLFMLSLLDGKSTASPQGPESFTGEMAALAQVDGFLDDAQSIEVLSSLL